MHTLKQYHGHEVPKATERELFFVQSMQDADIELFYSNHGDFRTRDIFFEVGGKSKSRKQLKVIKSQLFLSKMIS